MVSLVGAKQAQPVVQQIELLQAGIAELQSVLKAGPTIWKMTADVYAGPQKNSQHLEMVFGVNEQNTAAILKAVLDALQDAVTAADAQLTAIT